MYKKSLKKIIKLVEASQELDQLGYTEKSIEALYNAFEIAEDASYKIANKINNMEKTASKNIKASRVQELENMVKISAGIGSWLGGLLGKGSKWLTEKAAPAIGKLFGREALPGVGATTEEAAEALAKQPGLAKWIGGLGKTMEGAGRDITRELAPGERNLSRFIRTQADKNKALAKLKNMKNQAGSLDEISNIDAQIKKVEAIKPGLTDLGKLTAGTAGIGTAAALGFGRDKEQPIDTTTPYGVGGGVPTGGVGGMPIGIPGGGVPTSIPGGVSVTPEISQRLSNLEQIVQAIRMKVGV